MGQKTRLVSDPSLARAHTADAKINPIQLLTHQPLGAIAYHWPRLWKFHYQAAIDALNRLVELQQRLAEVEPGEDQVQTLADMDFLERVYCTGTEMVSNGVRALQHLCEEIERTTKLRLSGSTLQERLAQAHSAAGLSWTTTHDGYQGVTEIIRIRDAVEHPKEGNVYSGHPTAWDRVPLAWMLSDRSIAAGERWYRYFTGLADRWGEAVPRFSRPGTLTGVKRGIRSELSVKKPPRPETKDLQS